MTPADNDYAGIDFSNDLTYTEALNPYTYRNFYNGGGVGIGDFDGNGLQDIFFTGNLVDNRLYLNRGDFHFEEVTQKAGVACPDSWSTGVAVVDINADGHLDIYVCKAGPPAGEDIPGMSGVRHNELFINNGDATFRQAAKEYGLDIVGLSVHAAFFDYDLDGDLDCYLLNNSTRSTTGYDLKKGLREIPDPEGGNKLLQNQLAETGKATYVDVSQEADIYSSSIGFGLGVTVGDVDLDGYPDLFVSNDYFERDYLYLNNGDGTFRERLTEYLPEISKGSMGADLADLNNDGLPELFVTEMLPRTERRYKTKAAFDGWNRYQLYRDRGYHQQFSRNVLQLNRGEGRFSEVGRMAGVAATDWSWGALLFDADNDGLRDIFVANGSGKDLLDQDYINFNGSPDAIRRMLFEEGKGITDIIDQIPSEPLVNGVFRNRGGMQYEETATEWGLDQTTFSNGSAYADLDNDGDLDLVVNHIDQRAGIYQNNAERPGTLVRLRTPGTLNPFSIGAMVYALYGDSVTVAELNPMRGFESTVDYGLHFAGRPDSLRIEWPRGQLSVIAWPDTAATGTIELPVGHSNWTQRYFRAKRSQPAALQTVIRPLETRSGKPLLHAEDPTSDFNRDPLLFWGLNNEGPALSVSGDLLYLGGAAGQAGQLFRRLSNGKYRALAEERFARDAAGENVAAAFFDADGDGDADLYVANGSNQFTGASTALLDVLYLNQGGDRWERSTQLLPSKRRFAATSCVRPHDVDQDGDLDLFVGGRLRPGTYGVPAESFLLRNDGQGNFSPVPQPGLTELGMVTDAVWANVDEDDRLELIVAAEWSPLRYLHWSANGRLESIDTVTGTAGLWQCLAVADFDGDGRQDVAAGNHGLNTRLYASSTQPLELHVNDFDGNGKAEQITVQYGPEGRAYPLVLRDDLVKQLPALRKDLPGYLDYQGKTLADLFSLDLLARSVVNRVEQLASLVVLNRPTGPELRQLPDPAQLSPIYALAADDLNGDGIVDLVAGGNQSVGRPELGIYAASFGSVLLGQGDGTFRSLEPGESGLILTGDIRGILPAAPPQRRFLVARSGGSLLELQMDER